MTEPLTHVHLSHGNLHDELVMGLGLLDGISVALQAAAVRRSGGRVQTAPPSHRRSLHPPPLCARIQHAFECSMAACITWTGWMVCGTPFRPVIRVLTV